MWWAMNSPLLAPAEGEATRNQLNAINGCYVPCLLNILGAILYLRIGFSVGMMGMLGTLGIFFVSQGIAYLTIGSFSAIVTNGKMKGGGAYYMISRNLGPAFGGSRYVLWPFPFHGCRSLAPSGADSARADAPARLAAACSSGSPTASTSRSTPSRSRRRLCRRSCLSTATPT